jgi:PAS domain S-box-containing protein
MAIMVNDQFCKIFGYEREALLKNSKIQDLIAPEYKNFVRRQIVKHLLGPYEVVGLRADGSRFPIEIRVREISHKNRIIRVVSVSDLSERIALEQRIEMAAYEERERLEQELHDGACQDLVASSYLVTKLRDDLRKQNTDSKDLPEKICELLQSALREVKNIGMSCQSIPATSSGLYTALESLAGKMSSFGDAECRFLPQRVVMIPYRKELTELYMIAREAAINAATHAEANTILIDLFVRDGKIVIQVEDDGKGIMPENSEEDSGMGLNIMQNRAGKIGAALKIELSETGGTFICCEL